MDKVTRLASENGLVLFSKSSCCLCYAVKILFQEIGVTPTVHELDQDPEGREMERALMRLGCSAPVPAVFIGGKLTTFGSSALDKERYYIPCLFIHLVLQLWTTGVLSISMA
ncbi:hypothetical protein PVK06_038374 [Gossypium arboreum]|uniref:Glutaredoxin domain-containing protein n=1 Tax=Gossypium arboreum TaxID=29729 RepID=A0ABR0N001_GOSAR|nr:hypothetical protein PVK06_038374 [Gossypium arboreum]